MMLTDAHNKALSTSYNTLCRDAGAIYNILQMGNFSFPGPHCTQAPAARAKCVCEFVYDVCSYVCEHVEGRACRASKGLFTMCVSKRAR